VTRCFHVRFLRWGIHLLGETGAQFLAKALLYKEIPNDLLGRKSSHRPSPANIGVLKRSAVQTRPTAEALQAEGKPDCRHAYLLFKPAIQLINESSVSLADSPRKLLAALMAL